MINLNPDLKEILNMIGGNANQDIGYSSGQRYAQSIAGGQNVPGMIAPGVSYSMENPQGYTQAELNAENRFYNPGLAPVMPSAPTQGNPVPPDYETMPGAPTGTPNTLVPITSNTPNRYSPIITDADSLKNLTDLFNVNLPNNIGVSFDPFIPGEPMAIDDLQPTLFDIPFTPPANNLPSTESSPIDFSFNPFVDSLNVDPVVDNVVIDNLPSTGSSQIDFTSPINFKLPIDKPYEPIVVDQIPQPIDVPVDPMPSYFVPETPVVSLQDLPTSPVGMPKPVLQEIMQEQDAQQELQDIIASKEILQEIPAADGIRNEYQMAINDFINESPINKEVYKAELPIGSAINLGVPSLFENVVAPAVIPGLGFVKEASQSFNNNNNFSAPSPAPSFNVPSPGIDYSNIYNFGR